MKRHDKIFDPSSDLRNGGLSQFVSYEKTQASIDKDRLPAGLSNTTLPAFEDIVP
jgi:hypothetical protein